MSDTCIFTIVSKNYLAYARVLMRTVLEHHPEARRFVLLADKIDGCFDPSGEPFEVVEACELGIRDFASFTFKYKIMEFNTAVKPYFFDYLFSHHGFGKIVYLDPDIYVFRPLTRIFRLLEENSIVLTPHITQPIPEDSHEPSDHFILQSGCYNLGFLAMAKTESSSKFLAWWKEKLYDQCIQSPVLGYFVDQLWMNYVPSFLDDYYLLKEPGYNVAYWNLHERTFWEDNGVATVNGQPLFFFHFSGIPLDDLDNISKHQDRYSLLHFPALRPLFEMYRQALFESGVQESAQWPYHYGSYNSGKNIPDVAREVYWSLETDSRIFGNPFSAFWRRLFRLRHVRLLYRKRAVFILFQRLHTSFWKVYNKVIRKS
jgi:lipopolysaccharide biosynthesis glycosyltransferase